MKDTKYELLVVIANHGYSDLIMDAAPRRAAAARSSTPRAPAWRARKNSSAFPLPPKNDDLHRRPPRQAQRHHVAIMRDAGMASKAKSICFTLPVSATAGLRLLEDD